MQTANGAPSPSPATATRSENGVLDDLGTGALLSQLAQLPPSARMAMIARLASLPCDQTELQRILGAAAAANGRSTPSAEEGASSCTTTTTAFTSSSASPAPREATPTPPNTNATNSNGNSGGSSINPQPAANGSGGAAAQNPQLAAILAMRHHPGFVPFARPPPMGPCFLPQDYPSSGFYPSFPPPYGPGGAFTAYSKPNPPAALSPTPWAYGGGPQAANNLNLKLNPAAFRPDELERVVMSRSQRDEVKENQTDNVDRSSPSTVHEKSREDALAEDGKTATASSPTSTAPANACNTTNSLSRGPSPKAPSPAFPMKDPMPQRASPASSLLLSPNASLPMKIGPGDIHLLAELANNRTLPQFHAGDLAHFNHQLPQTMRAGTMEYSSQQHGAGEAPHSTSSEGSGGYDGVASAIKNKKFLSAKPPRASKKKQPTPEEDGDDDENQEQLSPRNGRGEEEHEQQGTAAKTGPNKRRERWTPEEHEAFLEGLKRYGRRWTKIQALLKHKTASQIRVHAYSYFSKVMQETGAFAPGSNGGAALPPPSHAPTTAATMDMAESRKSYAPTLSRSQSGDDSGADLLEVAHIISNFRSTAHTGDTAEDHTRNDDASTPEGGSVFTGPVARRKARSPSSVLAPRVPSTSMVGIKRSCEVTGGPEGGIKRAALPKGPLQERQ